MAVCGRMWPYVALYGHIWSFVVVYGLFMVLYGFLWSFMAKYWFYWTCIIFSRGYRSTFIWSCFLILMLLCYSIKLHRYFFGQMYLITLNWKKENCCFKKFRIFTAQYHKYRSCNWHFLKSFSGIFS